MTTAAIAGLLAASFVLVAFPSIAHASPPTTGLRQSSSIKSGFNSFDLPSGDVVWFSAAIQRTGPTPTVDTNLHFNAETLTFVDPNGTSFTEHLFSSIVEYRVGATTATTVFDHAAFEWVTTVPVGYSGDVFLSGYSYYVPSAGLPGSTHVTWAGIFTSSECGFAFNWKWSAAVYSQFAGTHSAPHYASVGVKPVDDNQLSVYQNSDHAGTPENFTGYLVQGGTGGGGSNYTGSYSGTVGIQANACPSGTAG